MYKYLRNEPGHLLLSKVAIPLKKDRCIALQSSPLYTASERSISVNKTRNKSVSLLANDYETENFA